MEIKLQSFTKVGYINKRNAFHKYYQKWSHEYITLEKMQLWYMFKACMLRGDREISQARHLRFLQPYCVLQDYATKYKLEKKSKYFRYCQWNCWLPKQFATAHTQHEDNKKKQAMRSQTQSDHCLRFWKQSAGLVLHTLLGRWYK
jgi:hypothetical protein